MIELLESIYRELKPGGFVLLVLLVVGVVGWSRAFWWLLAIRGCTDTDRQTLQEWLRTSGSTGNRPNLNEHQSELLEQLYEPVQSRSRPIKSSTARDLLDRAIRAMRSRYETGLRMVRVCAVILPLIGLFGTLTGIIRSFDALALFGTGNIQMLSNGISQALLTTQAGLLLAVPLVFMSQFMNSLVNHHEKNMELVAHELMRNRPDPMPSGKNESLSESSGTTSDVQQHDQLNS